MGWNTGWTIVEEQIIGVYDQGGLTLPVLDALCKPFRGSDIDYGGYVGLVAEDGKEMLQICLELVAPEFKANEPAEDQEWDDDVHTSLYDGFRLCMKRWGWR